MNSTKTIKMKCGKCQEEFDYSVYQYINVTGDTKLKKEVVNKEVFKVCCPKCGALHHMLFPLIYVDDEKKVVFSLITNTSKIEDFKKFFHDEQEMFFKDYTCRLVIDGHELAEKILISEAGLNDKVLEVVKVYILSTSKFDRNNLRNC